MPASLIEWLEREGCPPRTIVVDDGARLCSVAPLTKALVPSAWARDARTLASARAVLRVRHKASCALGLARRGLPIPPTLLASGPDDLGGLPETAFPLVVKPVLGDNAQGVRILSERAELDLVQWD